MIKYLTLVIVFLVMNLGAQSNIKTEVVEYKDGETVLQGFLVYDASLTGKRPGVLVVHEWWGHNEYTQMRARQLAELGYIAFALDMYGKGIIASDAQQAGQMAGAFYQDRNVMRQRAAAGLKVLQDHPMVDINKIAAIGFCFGGYYRLRAGP